MKTILASILVLLIIACSDKTQQPQQVVQVQPQTPMIVQPTISPVVQNTVVNKTIIMQQQTPNKVVQNQPQSIQVIPQAISQQLPKMDMAKLTQSASYVPPSLPKQTNIKPVSKMDMSKLSSSSITQTTSKLSFRK